MTLCRYVLVLFAFVSTAAAAVDLQDVDRALEEGQLRQADHALEQLRAAGTADSTALFEATLRLVSAYHELRQYDDAARLLTDLLRSRATLDDQTVALVMRLSDTLRASRHYEDAIALLEPVETSPSFSKLSADWRFQVQRRLAELYLQAGRSKAARDRYLALLEAYPDRLPGILEGQLIELYTLGGLAPDELDAIVEQLNPRDYTAQLLLDLLDAFAQRNDKARFVAWHDRILTQMPRLYLTLLDSLPPLARTLAVEADLVHSLAEKAAVPQATGEVVLAYARYLHLTGQPDLALEVARSRKGTPFLDLEAEILLQQGQFAQVLPVLESLCQAERQSPRRFELLGQVYAELGRKEKALEAWQQIPILPGYDPVLGWSRIARLCRVYQYTEEARFADRKVRELREVYDTSPRRLMRIALESGQYDAAIRYYLDMAQRVGAPDPSLRSSWLDVVQFLDATAQAEAVVSASAEALPAGSLERDWLLDLLVELQIKQERYADAIASAAKVRPQERPATLYRVGTALYRSGQDDAALEAYRQIEAGTSEYGARAATQRAAIAADRAQWAEVQSDLRKALAQLPPDSPNRAELLYLLADAGVRRADPAAALDALAQMPAPATREAAWSWYALLHAEAQLQLGAVAAASDALAAVIRHTSQPELRGRALLRLADLALWENDVRTARARYRSLIDGDPAGSYTPQALERLFLLSLLPAAAAEQLARATQYEWQGRDDNAIAAYIELAATLRDQPDGAARALLATARIEAARGNRDAVLSICDRALELAREDRLEAEIKWLRLAHSPPQSATRTRQTLERFVIDYADTLYADYARQKLTTLP